MERHIRLPWRTALQRKDMLAGIVPLRVRVKNSIGEWLMRMGVRLTGNRVYTIPDRTGKPNLSTMDLSKCECGHAMHDHLPEPNGHGTICLSCFATMRHRPVHADALEASVIGDFIED